MQYANNEKTKTRYDSLIKELKVHLSTLEKDKSLFFEENETIYIPDIHGDFIHLINTLHIHDLLDEDLNLKPHDYVFLGDIYDRSPQADIIDYWINIQSKNRAVKRLLGNHEFCFLFRGADGYPIIKPAQDAIKDTDNDFRITKELLENIISGNLLAAHSKSNKLYCHSYVTAHDYSSLDLSKSASLEGFCKAFNSNLVETTKEVYELFKGSETNWLEVQEVLNSNPLFNIYKTHNEISTSPFWRRTGKRELSIFPLEITEEIPRNTYQIVGHTPIFRFKLPKNDLNKRPFVLTQTPKEEDEEKKSLGKVQFSDVGMGYYYNDETFERPKVVINPKHSYAM